MVTKRRSAKKIRKISRYWQGTTEAGYKPAYAQALIDYCAAGKSFSTFGTTIGVSRFALTRWCKKHPDFSEARAVAEDMLNAWQQEQFEQVISGKKKVDKVQLIAMIFRAKNVALWRDRPDVEVSVTVDVKTPAEDAAEANA